MTHADTDWLALRANTLFAFDPRGRILRGRDPAEPSPRLHLQRSAEAVVLRLRHDLPDDLADELQALADNEPPISPPGVKPRHWETYRRLLDPIEREGGGPVYPLPHGLEAPYVGDLVRTGTPDGDGLVETWRREGLPLVLSDLGFTDADDVWRPWCMILIDGEPASLCQTARLKDGGAEVGVITAPAHRGKGLAAAVTAAWSRHPQLADVTLFYSTWFVNASSQAVAARLGLHRRAEDFSLF